MLPLPSLLQNTLLRLKRHILRYFTKGIHGEISFRMIIEILPFIFHQEKTLDIHGKRTEKSEA